MLHSRMRIPQKEGSIGGMSRLKLRERKKERPLTLVIVVVVLAAYTLAVI